MKHINEQRKKEINRTIEAAINIILAICVHPELGNVGLSATDGVIELIVFVSCNATAVGLGLATDVSVGNNVADGLDVMF